MNKRSIALIAAVAVIAALFFAGSSFLSNIYVPAILMYHSVGEEGTALDGYGPKLNVRTKTFAKQMKFLHESGYDVIPLSDLVERIKSGKRIPRKTVAITFDDGLKNNFYNAYPALRRYGFPATIFVVTDFIGTEKFLTRDDIITMQEDNVIVGSHTASHKWLPSLPEELVKRELGESKRSLEYITGREVKILSYPLGGFDERSKDTPKRPDIKAR
ncbi:MAG: polysaccharide deacetylase family protein [Candidatus Omnitrophota bacterium]